MTAQFFDPGKVRSMKRVLSSDGFFLVCAVDHLAEFTELLGDVDTVTFDDIVAAKDLVVRTVSPNTSAILLDPEFGVSHLINSGALPGDVGLIASLEEENYGFPNGPRTTIMREGWSPLQAKLAGVDMAKLLWFYRPDLDQDVAEAQRELVRELYEECSAASLLLVVEPIWYAVAGEDPSTEEWKHLRNEGIVSSAIAAAALGLDVLKIEFPGYVGTDDERIAAAEACQRIDAAITVPWVILSAGVSYRDFTEQLRIACQAGASGYIAGRSVWRDAVSVTDSDKRLRANEGVARRLDELNAITRSFGHPIDPTHSLLETIETVPHDWYEQKPALD